MSEAAHHRLTFDDYLRIEADSGTKHEFMHGQVFAMSGGTPAHARVTMNVGALLRQALRGQPCAVFSSDLRVHALATGLGTYADVTVICGKVELDPEDRRGHTALNPRVLVEVLSPSTEDYDRGEKLGSYKQIPSVEEVVLVAHDRREVEIVRRESDGSWSRHVARDGESAKLLSLGCELAVRDLYEDPLAP
jgi:Uma2 family endonuclease